MQKQKQKPQRVPVSDSELLALASAPPVAGASRDTKQAMRDAGASLARGKKKKMVPIEQLEVEVLEDPEVEVLEEPEVEVLVEGPSLPHDFPRLDLSFNTAHPKWRNNLHSRVQPRVKAYWMARGKSLSVATQMASEFWNKTVLEMGI